MGISDEKIQEMYEEFLEEDDRHTEDAEEKAEEFNDFVDDVTGGHAGLSNDISSKAMEMALEFEHSGFIAGVRFAQCML